MTHKAHQRRCSCSGSEHELDYDSFSSFPLPASPVTQYNNLQRSPISQCPGRGGIFQHRPSWLHLACKVGDSDGRRREE